jgi:tRNA-dihydrouridine synthase
MRTGWSGEHKNAVALARAFEGVGIQMLTVHGRTREQGYKGQAEYDTVAAVKAAVRVPVVANGDIDTPFKAAEVLRQTGADAVMIGSGLAKAVEAPGRGYHWGMAMPDRYLPRGTRVRARITGYFPRRGILILQP